MKISSATWTTKNRKSDRGAQVKQNVLYFLFLTTFPSFCYLVKVTERVEDLQSTEAPFSKGILCFHNVGTAQKTSLEQIHKRLGIRIIFHSKFYPQDLLLCLKKKVITWVIISYQTVPNQLNGGNISSFMKNFHQTFYCYQCQEDKAISKHN